MDINANTVIDKIGGTGATAVLCEISPGAVSQWRKDGIPPARLMYLKLARPDVFEATTEAPETVQQAA